MISLTIARNPDGTEKHTLRNARETGEFCFNVVTEQLWREMVDSANAFPAGDSEFSETGLTPIPSIKIAAPRVKEVPIHFECKLGRVLELGPNRHPLVIGEVVYMHVDRSCMTNGYIDMKKLNPIGRLNGFSYAWHNLRARVFRWTATSAHLTNVCFWKQSGHQQDTVKCPFLTQSAKISGTS
jgi:flavin reductase (DIM6/NTAB) family NADH-FMN oxidoreductase RutF